MNYYKSNSSELFGEYNSLPPAEVHSTWLAHLPSSPGLACDLGAGSGRDANWLAEQGWNVTAVEPCDELRELAQANSHANVTWLNDSVPALTKLTVTASCFDLILCSAMWMHLSFTEQAQALSYLKPMLADKGIIVITWRNVAGEVDRGFYDVDERFFGNATIIVSDDQRGREGVVWKCVVLTKANLQG